MNHTCILIPVYNHRDALLQTLLDIQYLNLPCIAINDGSTDGSKEVLDRAALDLPWITVLHLPENGGKGTAVLFGLKKAKELHYSHALLIDADGQHAAPDAVKFLKASSDNPEAAIIGAPQFDQSAPRVRLYGREVSNILAWIQTLCLQPRDVLCGFRLLPLNDVCEKVWSSVKGRRMDFDPEFIVKLSWAGVSFINIKTPVTYPKDGISHFNYLADNIRIAKSNVSLFGEMLLRLPFLLMRLFKQARFP